MSKPLAGVPGNENRAALVLQTPDEVAHVDLTGAAVAVAIPAGAKFAVFAATGDFAVQWKESTVAVFPAATAAAGELPELNPAVRFIGDRAGFTVPAFSVIGDGTGVCSISFYT